MFRFTNRHRILFHRRWVKRINIKSTGGGFYRKEEKPRRIILNSTIRILLGFLHDSRWGFLVGKER
jgi:hypothetical protein